MLKHWSPGKWIYAVSKKFILFIFGITQTNVDRLQLRKFATYLM